MTKDTSEPAKRRYCLWTMILVLGAIGLCNLLISIAIITVLRIGRGMESIELIPSENLIKFLGRTDLDNVSVAIPQTTYSI